MHKPTSSGLRVLVSAPYGSDAESAAQLLRGEGQRVLVCPTLHDIAEAIDEQAGVVLVTEEALFADLGPLHRALEAQPAWSDVPFILLAGRQAGRLSSSEAVRRRLPENALSVILLERPVSGESLVSAVASAMRARQKQLQIRDQLAALDAERSRLNALLDNLPVGVGFVDRDGNTLLSNPAFLRFLPSGEIPARLPDAEQQWEGYDEEGGRITRDRFVTPRALKGEHVTGVEFLHHPPTGKPVWTRVSGVPLRDASGTVTGAISVIVDIDEQKRGQQALAQAAQRLEQEVDARTLELREALARLEAEAEDRARAEEALRQAQKMEAVGQLTGGIAHDFNNMLTGIIGAIDILKRRIANGRLEDLDRFMDAASTSAQRAAALTARLLAFSRRQSLDSKPTDIGNLVHSLEDLLRRTMSESIEVQIVSATSLPPALVDANQLESAIINLAINARDAMPDGGRLTLACEEQELDAAFCVRNLGVTPGRYVVVAVSDTGVGMDAATLDKVFDPFFTTKPIGQGTGLGLSMVYGFAKQSNGLVRIHSTLGEGTSVKIFLPVADAEPEEQTAESAPIHHGDGQSVLLVEDDESVRLLVRDVLEELGYKATEAPDGQQAVRILEDGQRFDLMISDVGLPGMNGRQLAEIAREHLPDLPILFITGYAESAAVRGGFLSNNMQMITKPFQIEMLSARIREMLES
ncbi:PAS domain-containing hybrid sensor histidine kinase/response regulator [Sphingobium sp. EP60837]|uniref:PAS domain-containing hybrid sensor histidine kinase/response regulator n=1 Tax=Sphingobium sp. EP60837 TaxID=1855519 RepID=UPI0007DDF714|nr:PAS domain-containing hybrid sensor histidine kinase/response regulator [Sphingobium sp. EP60837]ANI79546.1 Histidine kinase [Sphingobium sp. EP60837]